MLLICFACGFDSIKGEEWKVMGMAPCGTFDQELYDKLSRMLYVDGLRIRGRACRLTGSGWKITGRTPWTWHIPAKWCLKSCWNNC